ncbi:CPBP family intramembrane glutamic endopeptidase [Ekhidna sp. To15]|uniref:CPBP family intramembrane glutamic endopeptidase n=1 Tax=Ekhidna sp. To15 TaxID=3395267 RepID=UPI003F51ADAE
MKNPRIKDLIFVAAILGCITFISMPFVNMIAAAIVVIIYATVNKEQFSSIGFSKPASWLASFVQSIFLAVVIVALVMYIIRPTIEYLTHETIDLTIYSPLVGNPQLLMRYLLIGWVIGGICEELIFRGFFLERITHYISGGLGTVIAIILTSTLFGYLHSYQGISGQLTTGIIGAILGTIYFLSGRRVLLTILTHGMINTICFSLIYFDMFTI